MDMLASTAVFSNTLPAKVGIGLKPQHYEAVLDRPHRMNLAPHWLEVHPQNYFCDGGPPHRWLSAIAEVFPISFHSVGLSLGTAEGLIADQLDSLAALCERYEPAMVSDHLSFSGNAHDRFSDLLPIPYTKATLDHFSNQISRVQDRLKRQILIENPSCYLAYRQSTQTEPEFIAQLVQRSGCGLLLDLNNIMVSTGNLGGAAQDYLDHIDPNWVGEIHLAGHAIEQHASGPLYIDDHGSAVSEQLWNLYARFIERAGPKPTLIEWDTDVPDYAILLDEAMKADDILKAASHADA